MTWQDGAVFLAAFASAAWLLRRWLRKRRVKAGCDQCAAAALRATERIPPR